jgi:hypothetical protein
MFAESFHRVLKHIYLKVVNKRLDKLINVLLAYSRDKAFDHILKIEKGKLTKRCTDVTKRHNLSLKLSSDSVTLCDNKWSVKSTTKPLTYYVEKNEACKSNCWISCQPCGICVHEYLCTCPDSVLCGTICKHIHLVVRTQTEVKPKPKLDPITSCHQLLASVSNTSRVGMIKERVLLKLSKINKELMKMTRGRSRK